MLRTEQQFQEDLVSKVHALEATNGALATLTAQLRSRESSCLVAVVLGTGWGASVQDDSG
jgi:hypothetical protein